MAVGLTVGEERIHCLLVLEDRLRAERQQAEIRRLSQLSWPAQGSLFPGTVVFQWGPVLLDRGHCCFWWIGPLLENSMGVAVGRQRLQPFLLLPGIQQEASPAAHLPSRFQLLGLPPLALSISTVLSWTQTASGCHQILGSCSQPVVFAHFLLPAGLQQMLLPFLLAMLLSTGLPPWPAEATQLVSLRLARA